MTNRDVLIVEDHSAVRATLQAWLATALPECTVFQATNGEEALAFVRDRAPCVVLMDLHLPGASGIDTTRAIKAMAPATLVVIVSLDESSAQRSMAAAAGASGYVAKDRMGFELVPLLERLLPRLCRPSAQRPQRVP